MILFLLAITPLFTPPEGWQCARPRNASPYVQVGYVGKGTTAFHPSINLATEEIDVPLKEYLKAVKEVHLRERNTTWRDLGKFNMQAGEGRLTEITSNGMWGEVKTYQAIYVEGTTAYILTAALQKKDISTLQKEIFQAFRSFSLLPDLTTPLSDGRKDHYAELLIPLGQFTPEEPTASQQKRQWDKFQKAITNDFPEMGSHWQFLALQEGYAKIYPPK